MKLYIILILLLLVACSKVPTNQDLLLNEKNLQELGLTEADCNTEQNPPPLTEYSICNYKLNNTEIVIELSKYSNFEDLNGNYQYSSSHLRSTDGDISENTFGDFSKFYKNSDKDYGGEFNNPNIFYYHLWIIKNNHLIHITSKGVESDKNTISDIGHIILGKFI